VAESIGSASSTRADVAISGPACTGVVATALASCIRLAGSAQRLGGTATDSMRIAALSTTFAHRQSRTTAATGDLTIGGR